MNILIYGCVHEKEHIVSLLEEQTVLMFRQKDYHFYDEYDSFMQALTKETYEYVIVTKDGADGMEGVIAARNSCPEAKVLWFSDDKAFGPQSYRLECAYFSVKPITASVMEQAMKCFSI